MFTQLFNKRFSRQQPTTQPQAQSPPPPPADPRPRAFNASVEGHLPPKHIAPPVPHPSPYARLVLHASPEGLLVRPDVPSRQCASYVCVSWNGGGPGGAGVDISLVTSKDGARWEGPVVYGVVGVITIYQESFLLVIADRKISGTLFSPSRPVYTIKSIAAIPLQEHQARTALNGLLARKTPLTPRPLDTPAEDVPDLAQFPQTPGPSRSNTLEAVPRVTFASEPIPIPNNDMNASTTSLALSSGSLSASTSGTSTPLSSSGSLAGPAPVAKTLLNKLSFWSTPARATLDTTPALDTTPQEGETEPEQVLQKILASESTQAPRSAEERNKELTKKVVREVVRQFSGGCMYYALDFDLATSLQDKHEQATKTQKENAILDDLNEPPKARRNSNSSTSGASQQPSSPAHTDKTPIRTDAFAESHGLLPLWLRVPQTSRRFWWNEVLAAPFVEAGAHAYVVPILQGHFQSTTFDLGNEDDDTEEPQTVEYALISRRSRDRAGLRYQRRGIDDDAHVANFVESEALVRAARLGSDNVFSYIQIRGSIPLFWSQPGLSLKPPLKLDRSVEESLVPARQHLQSCSRVCTSDNKPSPVTCVNLVEKGGREGVVGSAYGELVSMIGEEDLKLVDFDFHAETKGMKYENISKLVDQLERTFAAQGYFWVRDGEVMVRQNGVFRTNCIDCLDRTNVVQSAFARYVMNRQLQALALIKPTDIEADMVFNDVWANNGDSISRAYAGTSALKGDFTRTGRRDLGGMLNDGRNSIARMVTSNFGDYFAQATIDFMLGHRTTSVFSEFLLQLSSTDPREILKVSKIRASAIETTVERVLLENEHCVNAWTLLSPVEVGVAVSDKFVEKILVLSGSAIYIVCFDFEMDKVVSSRRVPLGDVVGIKQGAYILSTLHEASKDPAENYGFSITYRITHQDIRLTTYSMRNRPALPPPSPSVEPGEEPFQMPTAAQRAQATMMPLLRRASSVRRGAGMLSQILSASAPPPSPGGLPNDLETVSFKVLPVLDVHPDQLGVAPLTTRDAARRIVREVVSGCKNVGAGHEQGFVVEEDIVSLEQAQRITPVWAQLEYSFKRFLWLGS